MIPREKQVYSFDVYFDADKRRNNMYLSTIEEIEYRKQVEDNTPENVFEAIEQPKANF